MAHVTEIKKGLFCQQLDRFLQYCNATAQENMSYGQVTFHNEPKRIYTFKSIILE